MDTQADYAQGDTHRMDVLVAPVHLGLVNGSVLGMKPIEREYVLLKVTLLTTIVDSVILSVKLFMLVTALSKESMPSWRQSAKVLTTPRL